MNICVYTRKSTDRPGVQEESQEAQEQNIRSWREPLGDEIVQLYHEIPGIRRSTGVEVRPVFSQLLTDLKSKSRQWEALAVVHSDRISDNADDKMQFIFRLEKHGCRLLSMKDSIEVQTAADRLQMRVMSGFQRYETERIGERVYEHNLARALSGKWASGQPPLGLHFDPILYTQDPKVIRLIPNDRAPDVILLYETFAHTGSISRTCQRLNELGILTRKGNAWTITSVQRALCLHVYRRRVLFDGRTYPAPEAIAPLIPDELLARVDTLLATVRGMGNRSRTSEHCYSGLLRCSLCGSTMAKSTHSTGRVEWRCTSRAFKHLCDALGVANTQLDIAVGVAVAKLLRRVSAGVSADVGEKPTPKAGNSTAKLRKLLSDRRARVIDLYEAGVVDLAHVKLETERIDRDIAALAVQPQRPVVLPDLAGFVESFGASWTEQPQGRRREFLLLIQARIVVNCGVGTVWAEIHSLLPGPAVRGTGRSQRKRGGRRYSRD